MLFFLAIDEQFVKVCELVLHFFLITNKTCFMRSANVSFTTLPKNLKFEWVSNGSWHQIYQKFRQEIPKMR